MREILNFEEIADEYSTKINNGNSNMSKISRCDYLVIKENEILFIEDTDFSRKDLLNPIKYSKEIIENIKKMWGSLSIFNLYIMDKNLLDSISGRNRVYVLLLNKENKKLSRIISNIMKALIKYKDSGYSHIKYKLKS